MKIILIIVICVFLVPKKMFSQNAEKTRTIKNERLSREDLLIRGDKFYDKIREFLISESLMDKDKYIQISNENIDSCNTGEKGIYKFQTLSTNAQLFLFFKYNQDSIQIVSNYEIDSLIKSTLLFVNISKFTYQQKCRYLKLIIDFLQEKEEYEKYNEFQVDTDK